MIFFPGGELIAAILATDEEGQYTGSCKAIKQSTYTVLTELWGEMVQEGKITQVA